MAGIVTEKHTYYQELIKAIAKGEKLLAVLIDPEKMELDHLPQLLAKIDTATVTHLFVGGSTDVDHKTDALIKALKTLISLPIVLFPGDVSQLSSHADALLFLSLVSGRNPDYLIGKQVEAVKTLRHLAMEIIPTGYLLIESGKQTAVERVTGTKPLSRNDISLIVDTAKASELLGMKCVYLEAGSGALHPVSPEIISAVKTELKIPLIVGGGIRSKSQIHGAYHAGADLVVIGTAFEENANFFKDLNT